MPELALPIELCAADLIGCGSSGVVARYPGLKKVIKLPHYAEGDDDIGCRPRCAREKEAYERLEPSSSDGRSHILAYLGCSDDGIFLEYAEGGSIETFTQTARASISERRLLAWARQAAQAIEFCHSRGVLHGDIRCANFLLDHSLSLKLGDFTGSSVDESGSLSYYNTAYLLPESLEYTKIDAMTHIINTKTEIFAFGSALYEMVAGHKPYSELSEDEIEERFRTKQFPDVTQFRQLGPVMTACWYLKFDSMTDVRKELDAIGRTTDSFLFKI
ncbi:MAG: hypothetical protein M1825_005578 [Sarcosagium campestre]|nr:MAG: hypothetical protein M1825_005578 [Sarcosagium campestre]